jgi:hypothetical protein
MMKEQLDFLLQSYHLRCYLWSALILAAVLGFLSWPTYFNEPPRNKKFWSVRVGETFRCAIGDALIRLVGFLLAPTLLLFALVISAPSDSAVKIILEQQAHYRAQR